MARNGTTCPGMAAAIFVHDDNYFLETCIKALPDVAVTVFVSRIPWGGESGDWEKSCSIAELAGAEVIVGDWGNEFVQRKDILEVMRERGVSALLIPDTDEVLSPELLATLKKLAREEVADQVTAHMTTYWKDTGHVVDPPERLTPPIMVNPQVHTTAGIRGYQGGTILHLPAELGVIHHLSYAGPDERIWRKITTWGHSSEVLPDWWERKWLAWDKDCLLADLHPTHPSAYRRVVRVPVPEILQEADSFRPAAPSLNINDHWPRVSIVIPLYGGPEDIADCLDCLQASTDLLHEVIVVDDVSPDNAADVVGSYSNIKLIRRDSNGGFAVASNTGLEAATGEIVVFLNSDALLPRAALIRMVESLTRDNSVGAVGPLSDNVGYYQKIAPPYRSVQDVQLVAEDIAQREVNDQLVSMLVGFCLMLKTDEAKQLGGFDTSFGKGLFEDTDLCYRLQREGKRLVLCNRAFVHHKGSKSLNRMDESPSALLRSNEGVFRMKWRKDLESGFASHLAGDRPEPVQFDETRRPEVLQQRISDMANEADISLIMIVRDEERVIGDCLSSVKDVFSQTVVVDTGSVDRTKEIVETHGAELYEMEWPLSFSVARNESLKHARGKWVFWMDADDTLPGWCAERILAAATTASDDVVGFVVPVQFVENGQPSGTRVDHVKLFRNIPGLQFEGRIHEQILPALRATGGKIGRIDAYVLHSGYDTSEGGQAKKRKRDTTLLQLDLEERPDHPFVLFNLGMTAHYNGEHKDAVKWLQRSISVSGPQESHVRKAFALWGSSVMQLKDFDGALGVFREGLRVVQGDPELRFHAARCLTELGRYAEARLEYERMPSEPGGEFSSLDTGIFGYKRLYNMAVVCRNLGDIKAASHYYQSALGMHPDPQLALDIFSFALEHENFGLARHSLIPLKNMRSFEVWADKSQTLFESRGDDVMAEFEKQALQKPQGLEEHLAWGRALLLKNRLREGLQVLERLVSYGIPQASFYQGVALLQNGLEQEAKGRFEHTLRLDPGHQESVEIMRRISEID